MKQLIKYLLPLLFIIVASTQIKATAPNKPLPIEYFAKHSTAKSVKISPNGEYYAGIFKQRGENVLAIFNTSSRKPVGAYRVRGSRRAIGRFFWVSAERIVYEVTESSSWNEAVGYVGEVWAVNVDGGQHNLIFGYRSGKQQTGSHMRKKKSEKGNLEIIDRLENDDRNILIAFYPWKNYGSYWGFNPNALVTIFKLNVVTGKKKKIMILPLRDSHAVTDNNGEVRIAIGVNHEFERVVSYKKTENSEWKVFSLKHFKGKNIYPIRFADKKNSIYFSANIDDGTDALFIFNLDDETIEKIYHDESVDMRNFIFDFSDKKIIAIASELTVPKFYYIDKNDPKATIHSKLQKVFPGSEVRISNATKDGNKLIIYVYSDSNPGDYYLFDMETKAADYILSKKSWINPELMSSIEFQEFKMRDGTLVHGYLTFPLNNSKKNLPLVVFPHGGPHGQRDEWGFNWEVQLLANRGYAVLQLNYRGSSGFGIDFEEQGHGKWGTLMQDDLTDSTQNLIEKGIADPKRICIYGGSYGGYAALMGVIREPDLYKCAIGVAGVYDLPLMFTKGNIAKIRGGIGYLKDALGEDENDMKKRSPVHNVDKIKAEILLVHGAQDSQVPIEHAEQLMEAFDEIGKNYEWLELTNEAHGYQEISNRIAIYKKILAFLDKNIGSK